MERESCGSQQPLWTSACGKLCGWEGRHFACGTTDRTVRAFRHLRANAKAMCL